MKGVLNNPHINELINDRLWEHINLGSQWDTVQMLEHQMMADEASRYLQASDADKTDPSFNFVRDEASDYGLTPEEWALDVLRKREYYYRLLRATRRARTLVLKGGSENKDSDSNIEILEEALPALMARYVLYDQ